MNGLQFLEQWREGLIASFRSLAATVGAYFPLVMGAILIILIGWLVSKMASSTVGWVLRRSRIDQGAARLRVTEALAQAGISTKPSNIIASLVFWVLILTFARAAVQTLNLTLVTTAIEGLAAYVPNLIAAALIMLLGLLLGRLTRNLIGSGAAASQLPQASRLGAAAYVVIMLIAAVMALERLGMETAILVTTFTAVIAALTLTMGLAFALGAKPLITHILAGHFLRGSLPPNSVLEVQGRRGSVKRVGPVDTVLTEGDRTWSIPNARLLEEVVER